METKGMVKGLRLDTLKAKNLKSRGSYWVRKGVHVHKIGSRYCVTTLYDTNNFNTIKEAKHWIREGSYLLTYFM